MSKATVAIESESNSAGVNSSSMTTGTASKKLCHLIKRPDFEGYGFNLHSEKSKPGQYIGKVDANSPAESAGLLEGERIIEVNGVNIGNETHKQVVQRIKALSGEVRLLLVSADAAVTSTATTNQLNANLSTKTAAVTSTTISNSSSNNRSSNISNSDTTNGNAISTKTTAVNGGSNQQQQKQAAAINATTPPPPSSVSVSSTKQDVVHNSSGSSSNNNPLQLPMTAAEMRAKLLAKKKYDPKNEAVDLKKKYEIIQKL